MSGNLTIGDPGSVTLDSTAPAIRLQWRMHTTPGPAVCYRIAGQIICADAALGPLTPFVSHEEDCSYASQPGRARDCAADWQLIYQDTAWLGNGWRPLSCWSAACGYRIQAAGMGHFAIDAQGRHVQRLESETSVSPDLTIELLLGPVLTLALALHGVWCLHASAVALNGRAVAFLGDSGAGKSTLARFLTEQDGADFRRIADDVLPVELTGQGVMALPHFPQLKLPPHAQVGSDCPTRVPLEAVYRLESQDSGAAVAVRPLTKPAATLTLLRQTIAARLFDAKLLGNHLSFGAEAAESLPVQRLFYPHRLDALPAVLALLQRQ